MNDERDIITSTLEWKRVLALRRALIPHILLAGSRPPAHRHEVGPQHFVCLSDDLDDVLYAALEREAQLAKRRER